MLQKPLIIIHEDRPIERRGKKRASPLIEMSLSYREEVISYLMSLQQFIVDGVVDFDVTIETEDLLINMGHLTRQVKFKRQNKQ